MDRIQHWQERCAEALGRDKDAMVTIRADELLILLSKAWAHDNMPEPLVIYCDPPTGKLITDTTANWEYTGIDWTRRESRTDEVE